MIEYIKKNWAEYKVGFRAPIKSLSWILITVGVLVCLWLMERAGAYEAKPANYPEAWTGGWIMIQLGKLAQLTLIGFSTAFFTRFAGGMGMFRDALADLMGDDRWLDRRNDLEALWRRVTRRIFMPGFRGDSSEAKALLEQVNGALTRAIHSQGSIPNYYAKNVTRRIEIEWKDTHKKEIIISDFVASEVLPYEDVQQFEYKINHWIGPGATEDDSGSQVSELRVDGQVIEASKSESPGMVVYAVTLAGKKSYSVTRTIKYVQQLDRDPIFTVVAGRVVWGMNVIASVKETDLRLNFQEVGVEGELKLVREDPTGRGFERDTRGVLLPEQGFVIVIVPQIP